MPEQIHCPSCDATLRVPDTLLGKNVKCPKCQTTFTASADAPAETEGIVNEPIRSSRRPSPPPEEDENEDLPPEDEDEDRPRRRRRGSAAAASAVAGPAIAMMVVAGLDIAWAILDLLLRILGVSLIAAGGLQGGGKAPWRPPGQEADTIASLLGGIGADVIGVCFAILILAGALKMKSLSNYGLAMTACIVSMIPCHACCCLGLPFGIWGLVMLNKPEVKDAFARNR